MKNKFSPLVLIFIIIVLITFVFGCKANPPSSDNNNSTSQPTIAPNLATQIPTTIPSITTPPKAIPGKITLTVRTLKPTKLTESTPKITNPNSPTTTPKPNTLHPTKTPIFKVGYKFSDTSNLKNVSFTVESYYDGTGTFEEYQVFRTKNKIKIQINGDPDVIGTVQYLVPCLKEDNKKYSHLKFYYSRPGADTGYDGSDLKSPYDIWKIKDVTKLLNGGKAKQIGTSNIDGNPVVIYSITENNKIYKIYFSKKYKVWLKYDVYIDNKLDEKWTIKKFSVGKVTETDADFKTKLPGHPEQDGYALINISEMIK